MEELTFFDMKSKQKFTTSDYKIEVRGNRRFAVAISPSGAKSMRIVGKGG